MTDGRIALVRGGHDGIELAVDDDGAIILTIENFDVAVKRLAWHTHPRPTGPSDFDRALIGRLDQNSSVLYEINGPVGGTVFKAIRLRNP